MGFVFRGYDDETGIPRFDYIPDEKTAKELMMPSDAEPKGITPVPQSSPSPIPPPRVPIVKPVADPPCTVPCLLFVICVLGTFVIAYHIASKD